MGWDGMEMEIRRHGLAYLSRCEESLFFSLANSQPVLRLLRVCKYAACIVLHVLGTEGEGERGRGKRGRG